MNHGKGQAAAGSVGQEAVSFFVFGKEVFVRRQRVYPWLYAAGILLGELLVIGNARAGVLVHLLVLGGLLVHAAFVYGKTGEGLRTESGAAGPGEEAGTGAGGRAVGSGAGGVPADAGAHARFYLALTLAPLIRILSLSLPLAVFPLVYWYAVVSFPLLAGAAAVAVLNGYRRRELGLTWGSGRPLLQPLIGLAGFPLGLAEYFILRPQPLAPAPDPAAIWLPALILLVCTGFTEEFIFRGIMQKAAADLLGWKTALVLVSFIFAVLHITHLSVVDVVFVFGVAAFFSAVVYRTGSLFGVTIAHGLTNITMYLIWPFVF